MQEKRHIRNVKIFIMTIILAASLCFTTTSFAAPKKKPAKGKSTKGKSSKSRGKSGKSSSKRGRSSRGTASRSSKGGKKVAVRDSHGRVKRDRHGRVIYAR